MVDSQQSSRATVAIAVTGVVGVLMSIAASICRGWPIPPSLHDEFSYLLAADTFLHGRLTNPTPAAAESFESFHILVTPTYASKYPPGQGLLLAAGSLIGGHPIAGVWLAAGLLTATLTWMLIGWTSVRWSIFGSLLMLLVIVGQGDPYGVPNWLATYWGGTLAAIGGALVFGGARRIALGAMRGGLALGSGLSLLMLTRPFEGLLVSIPALVSVLRALMRGAADDRWRTVRMVGRPTACVLLLTVGFLGVYNYRVTGHALRMPYLDYEAQYSTVPLLLAGPRRTQSPPTVANATMLQFDSLGAHADHVTSLPAFLRLSLRRLSLFQSYFAPSLVTFLLLVGSFVATHRQATAPLIATVLVVTGSFFISWFQPHYVAPLVAPLALVIVLGAMWLASRRPAQAALGKACIAVAFAHCLYTSAMALYVLRKRAPIMATRWPARRDAIDRTLSASRQRHLVMVSYGPRHSPDNEWVYNGADLATDEVLFARWLTPTLNALLMRAYPNRVVWRLHIDDDRGPFILVPALPAVTVTQRSP